MSSTENIATQQSHVDRLDTVTRTVTNGERDGIPTKSVTLSQAYPVGVHELWDAVTDGERISRWLMPITGDLRLGGHYQLEGNAGGTIEECVPAERLAVTWEYGGEVSWVVARLTGDDTSSSLHVEHVAHVDDERWGQFGPGAVGIGWDMMLLGLTLHLSSGVGMTPEEGAAWTATDDGRAFMRGSGKAWCEAQVASGEDEVAAREASERCLTAYLG